MGCKPSGPQPKYMQISTKDRSIKILSEEDGQSAIDSYDQTFSLKKFVSSGYEDLIRQYQGTDKAFDDLQFPANRSSIGEAQLDFLPQWRRIPLIYKNAKFLQGTFGFEDVMQGQLGDCYVLSAISSLAQFNRMDMVFPQRKNNANGIYIVRLMIQGKIQQIIVDDKIPVNKKEQAIFAQPAKGEFWPLIFQKAWAKCYGSYGAIVAGIPNQVLRAASFAPSFLYILKQESSQAQKQKIWSRLLDAKKWRLSCCCSTESVIKDQVGLIPGHAYGLVQVYDNFQCFYGKKRILKIRNPWGKGEWTGRCSDNDSNFMNSLSSQFKKRTDTKSKQDGVFFIMYEDFTKYFQCLDICHAMENYSSTFVQHQFQSKRASYAQIDILRNATTVYVTLSQTNPRGKTGKISRATIIVIKVQQNGEYSYVGSKVSNPSFPDVTVQVTLLKGKHLVYAKFDWINQAKKKGTISIYSRHPLKIKIKEQTQILKSKNLIQRVLLSHALKLPEGKGKTVLGGNDFIATKFLFLELMMGYIVINIESERIITVSFDQMAFQMNGFKLKKPYKYKGVQEVQVSRKNSPFVLVARVKKDNNLTKLNFPPQVKIMEG